MGVAGTVLLLLRNEVGCEGKGFNVQISVWVFSSVPMKVVVVVKVLSVKLGGTGTYVVIFSELLLELVGCAGTGVKKMVVVFLLLMPGLPPQVQVSGASLKVTDSMGFHEEDDAAT